MTEQELLRAVLGLPPNERARFARELLLSLDEGGAEQGSEAELIPELDRRRAQADAGEVEMLDRAEFDRALAQRRAARRTP